MLGSPNGSGLQVWVVFAEGTLSWVNLVGGGFTVGQSLWKWIVWLGNPLARNAAVPYTHGLEVNEPSPVKETSRDLLR